MLRQSLASGLPDAVAAADPPLAAVNIDMQSVFMLGGLGQAASTKSMAHNSAAAAVAIRDGGVP